MSRASIWAVMPKLGSYHRFPKEKSTQHCLAASASTRLQRCLPPLLSARLGVLWLAMLTHCMSVHKCMAGNPEKRWATPERKSPEIPQHD